MPLCSIVNESKRGSPVSFIWSPRECTRPNCRRESQAPSKANATVSPCAMPRSSCGRLAGGRAVNRVPIHRHDVKNEGCPAASSTRHSRSSTASGGSASRLNRIARAAPIFSPGYSPVQRSAFMCGRKPVPPRRATRPWLWRMRPSLTSSCVKSPPMPISIPPSRVGADRPSALGSPISRLFPECGQMPIDLSAVRVHGTPQNLPLARCFQKGLCTRPVWRHGARICSGLY